MDTTTIIQAIEENTASVQALTGTLWVYMGFFGFLVVGVVCIKYTFKGR